MLAATAAATVLLVPLYQFPTGNGEAWTPLPRAPMANPLLTTKFVINPNDGPGESTDSQYLVDTKALAAHPIAQLLRYVHTSTNSGKTHD